MVHVLGVTIWIQKFLIDFLSFHSPISDIGGVGPWQRCVLSECSCFCSIKISIIQPFYHLNSFLLISAKLFLFFLFYIALLMAQVSLKIEKIHKNIHIKFT